ncbi:MAG: recombination protein RmuC [Patescibacteria group bacterium]|nr:recombination protein RmuC [Patescibacteria group bacterium]
MDIILLITILIAVVTLLAIGGIILYLKKLNDRLDSKDNNEVITKWMESMQGTFDTRLKDVTGAVDTNLNSVREQLNKTTEVLNQRADVNSKTMNERLDKTSEIMRNVSQELGSMSEIGRGMKSLQDFLKSPKLRGNLGEQGLYELLKQALPSNLYATQHEFKGGVKVDAVIRIQDGLLPVDSKFSLENFSGMMQSETEEDRNRYQKEFVKNVKERVKEISTKYILPEQGTVDFAFMYVPSEAIYYEIIVNYPELNDFAQKLRVLPVSPNTISAYIRALLIGVEGQKVQAQAKEILRALRGIKDDSNKFSDHLRLLGKHLSNAGSALDDASKRFDKLDAKINSVSSLQIDEPTGPEHIILPESNSEPSGTLF